MVEDQPRRAPLWPIRDTPAGGINAAISDMARYLRFHLGGGACDDVRLLSPAGVTMLQTPHVHAGHSEFDETGDYHYGLGFGCNHYRGERAVGHDGGWPGWGTRMDMLPDRNIGVVVLTNRQPSPVPEMLCHTVFDQVCGKPPIAWFDRFLTRRRQFLKQQRENRQVRDAVRRPGTRPSHALGDYAASTNILAMDGSA